MAPLPASFRAVRVFRHSLRDARTRRRSNVLRTCGEQSSGSTRPAAATGPRTAAFSSPIWPCRRPAIPSCCRMARASLPVRVGARDAARNAAGDGDTCAPLLKCRRGLRFCGAKRSRTADLLSAIQALYQLSYSPRGRLIPRSSGEGPRTRTPFERTLSRQFGMQNGNKFQVCRKGPLRCAGSL